MELITIDHLSFSYPEQSEMALKDISLTVCKGEFLVLCGHSGSGKSTLLRHLKPSLTPHGERSGIIRFRGGIISSLAAREAAAKLGFVMQSPEAQVVTDKVWHELAFGMESLGFDTPAIRRRCAEMAAFFGIEPWYYKDVSELSGGQKQLLCLASVMTMQPEVLILDEPTAQLDPIAASEFLSTLGKINRELGTTVILSEHRLEEALALANRAAVMEDGEILCCGSVREIGEYLKHHENNMFSAMPCAMRVWGSVESEEVCPVTVNEGREFLRRYTASHAVSEIRRTLPERAGAVRLEARELWFRYEKDQSDVVRGLDLTVREGELFCILGGNGSGKTTSLKLLSGVKKAYRGEVKINGTAGLLPQDPSAVFLKNTVQEDLADILHLQGVSPEKQEAEIASVAALCEITHLLYRHPYDLSGGEKQRAALAKILLLAPDVLLLDEPTKGLDAPFKRALAGILRKLCNAGVSVIMVSHDVEFCASYADRCGLFFDGRLVTESDPVSFFSGNSFYTTAANRMAREIEPTAITVENVTELIGGIVPEQGCILEKAPIFHRSAVKESVPRILPLGRKIGAALCGGGALGMLLYAAKTGNLSSLIGQNGMTSMGARQLAYYTGFILLLILMAVFLGRRSVPAHHQQMPEGKRKLSRRTKTASALILLLIPLTLFLGVFYVERKQYYITAVAVLLECMIPFFLVFEGRKPRARELTVIATLCAMGIAGRAAFFMLPQFKPVIAMTIIAGVAFGGESGFLVGAVTMLVSNMLFSQGPWTPWQMFAMGIIGFLAGIVYRKGLLIRSRVSLCIFGAACAFLIYGGIMNPASALIWAGENLTWQMVLTYYLTGFPMDAVQAFATVLFLWFGAEPMLEKLDRIKVKYGLIETDL